MTSWKKCALGIVLCSVLALSQSGLAVGLRAQNAPPTKEITKVEDSIRVLQEMMKEADKSIPVKLLERSAGIAIIPDVIKAAYIVGGRHGNGLVCVRNKNGVWSNPVFIGITGGSVGWQIGVESADIILVFRTPRSVENFAKGKFTLGADAGVSAGPLGRSAEASTDAELKAEIYSYSRSRGLYAGLSLQGASLHVDAKANQNFYSVKGIVTQTIFEGKVSGVPDVAAKLRQALESFSGPSK
jgi:lipid-binding SYLF domain-containing protein